MRATNILVALAVAVLAVMPASAAPGTPVASKDGTTFTLEDMHIYWLRNLGKDGLLDFFQSMVIHQEGLKLGLVPTQAEIAGFIQDTMGQDIYSQFMELYSERAVKQLIEYTIVIDKYNDWLREKIRREQSITVTEADARDFFISNIEEFHVPEGVHLSIISV
ncbi:hypothetical protein IIA79_05525, partial [bacterium]|nr:hypothetical protein [bacterium]